MSGCSDDTTPAEKKKDRPQRVETVITQLEPVSEERRFNATVQAPNTIRITNQVAGLIMELPVRAGSEVKKGDLLVQLDDSLTKAEYQKARASLGKAQQDLKRISNLAAKQLASAEELATATTALKLAEAEATLKETQLKHSRISAPFDGVVSQHFYENNDTAAVNSHILTLVDMKHLIVKTSVPESMLAWIQPADPCKVIIPASALVLDSTIQTIYPTVDTATLQITLELSLAPGSHKLYPGQFAEAVISSRVTERLLLPVNAIQYDSKGPWVFVVVNDKAMQQRVTIGQHFGNQIEVISGLQPGMSVITRGFVGLRPGKKVASAGTDSAKKTDKEVAQ